MTALRITATIPAVVWANPVAEQVLDPAVEANIVRQGVWNKKYIKLYNERLSLKLAICEL